MTACANCLLYGEKLYSECHTLMESHQIIRNTHFFIHRRILESLDLYLPFFYRKNIKGSKKGKGLLNNKNKKPNTGIWQFGFQYELKRGISDLLWILTCFFPLPVFITIVSSKAQLIYLTIWLILSDNRWICYVFCMCHYG